MSRIQHVILIPLILVLSGRASAQFIWDGDCGLDWYECCNTGSVENPEWRNNWTIAPSPDTCPALPGPDDHVTCVKTVILQGFFQTDVKSLTVASTIDDAAYFSAFTAIDIEDFFMLSGNIVQPATYVAKNGTQDSIHLHDAEATATISSYATLDFQYDGYVVGPSTALLTNNGLILKSVEGVDPPGYDQHSGLNIPVQNNNTISAIDGTLVFDQACTNNGVIEALGEGEIRFQGGPECLLGGEVRGDGLIRFVSTTATVNGEAGDYHPTNTVIAGGGATVNFEVETSVENLTLGNSGTIGGAADLSIDDLLWNGGYSTMAPGGTTTVQDSMLIQHDSFAGGWFAINRDLELQGDSVIEGAAQVSIDDGELRNYGELQMLGASNIAQACCTPDSLIQNFGTLRKVSGEQSIINVPFFNLGEVAVESGTLQFGELQNDAAITVETGATLLMAHPQQINLDLGSITGPGTVTFVNDQHNPPVVDAIAGIYDVGTTTITGAQVEFQNDATTASLILNFPLSKLLGDGNFVVTEQFNWSAGEMAGTGTTIVEGPMTLSFAGYWLGLNRTLELNVDSSVGQDPPSTTMSVMPLGTLRCKSITIDTHVYNDGLVSPGTPTTPVAQLHVTGGYTQTPGGQLAVDSLGSAHDQLVVDGVATLNGTLAASGFPEGAGESFTILTAASIAGTFANLDLPDGMTVSYTPTSVIVHAAPGEPCVADIAPSGLPDGVVGPADLAALLAAWGACPSKGDCPADIAPAVGDGAVNAADLAQLLAGWGACP
jgi:hypothetical protein